MKNKKSKTAKTWFGACRDAALALARLETFERELDADLLGLSRDTMNKLIDELRPSDRAFEIGESAVTFADWWERQLDEVPAGEGVLVK